MENDNQKTARSNSDNRSMLERQLMKLKETKRS